MSTPLQQAAFRRKIVYFAAIVGLFALSTIWRGKIEVPLGNKLRKPQDAPTALNRTADWLSSHSVTALAERYDLRELDQGDPELAANTAKLALVGMRGIVVTALWRAAQEKQKRNEFHEFELYARTVTELQPNFITPWIFQSWNIAYNVSVENDKLGDMYFYIARGIELLATGDKRNTKIDRTSTDGRLIGSPDIRYQIGFYYQNKFGVSDKVNTLRSLMQLSAIPPGERKAGLFVREKDGIETVELNEFRKFCEKNPQLVRRLRTKLNCRTPEQVVQFLRDNETVPTLYKNDFDRAEPARGEAAFPVFPPRFAEGAEEYHHGRETNDSFDAFHASRAWFNYAITLIPPNKKNASGQPIPWRTPQPGEYDANRYRIPRSPALTLFVQSPPRAQTYLAERLTKEGWFDLGTGWNPDEVSGERRPANEEWFPNQDVILKASSNSQSEWERAHSLWNRSGETWAMIIPESVERALIAEAGNLRNMGAPTNMTEEQMAFQGITSEKLEAANSLLYYSQNKQVTNFGNFLAAAEAEKDSLTIQSRKLFWEADEARQLGKVGRRAPELFTQALARWRAVLAKYPNFHRGDRNDRTEEEAYEQELKLILMLKEDGAVRAKADKAAELFQVLIPMSAHPDVQNNLVKPDYRQVEAEKEAGTRIAAEMLVNVNPELGRDASDAERKAMARIEELSAIKIEPALNTIPALLGAAAASQATPKVMPTLLQREKINVARYVVDNEFPWMRELKYESRERDATGRFERGAYWVMPEIRDRVLEKEKLIRRPLPDPNAAPPAGPDGLPAPPAAVQQ
jgi:hypothetical protein